MSQEGLVKMNTDLRKTFDLSLKELKQLVLTMFSDVENLYSKMFLTLETMNKDEAQKIIDDDVAINALETRVNEMAYLVILKQCPVAKDLRFILTAIKISNDLERMADYAANSATYIIKTVDPKRAYNDEILKYKPLIMDMFQLIIKAYDALNISIAMETCDKDSFIDELYHQQLTDFVYVAKSKTDAEAEEASRALLVIKQLERAGDHITNIAEHIIYLMHGKAVDLN